MELIILLLSLLGLLAIRVPVAFALLISSMLVFALLGLNPLVAVQRLSAGIDVFTLILSYLLSTRFQKGYFITS